jgi:hypothetical protein
MIHLLAAIASVQTTWTPLRLFTGGTAGYFGRAGVAGGRWQDTAGTVPAALGQPLRRVDDLSPGAHHALEASTFPYLRSDTVDAVRCVGQFGLTVTFGGALGSSCTIGIAIPGAGAEIITHQVVGSNYRFEVPWVEAVIINRPMSPGEHLKLQRYLEAASGATVVMHHIAFGGQSLAAGTNTSPTGSNGAVVDGLNHDTRARMFTITSGAADYGPRPHLDALPANNNTVMVVGRVAGIEALAEGVNDVVGGRYGETPMTGFAAQALLGDDTTDRMLFEFHGRGGTGYRELGSGAALEPGWQHFCNGVMTQDLADVYAGMPRRARALCIVHGEFDASINRSRANYAMDLQDWVTRYNDHIRQAPRTLRGVPMLISQISNLFPAGAMPINMGMVDAADANALISIVCPKYPLVHSDGTHLVAASSRILGEYYGKVWRRLQRLLAGETRWTGPLRPLTAVRSGTQIVVTFHVPVGVLALNTTAVAAITNMGLVYTDDSSSASISGVAITGDAQLTVTLSGAPSGANPKLRFASTQATVTDTGPVTGARTNLCDEDAEVGQLSGTVLRNWCLHYEIPVTT